PKSTSSSARIDSTALTSSRPRAWNSAWSMLIGPLPRMCRGSGNGTLRGVGDLLVYHNPRCSKSRGALELLADRGADVEVIEYLQTPPDRATLEWILDTIG